MGDDKEFKVLREAEYEECFKYADSNGNGLIYEGGWGAFSDKYNELRDSRYGGYIDWTADEK